MKEAYFPGEYCLSTELTASGERRIPIRPLGKLSDLVVGQLPDALTAARKGSLIHVNRLSEEAESYAGELEEQHIFPGMEGSINFKVGRLDALMLYTGL